MDGPIYVDHPEGVLKVSQYTADDPNNRQITWELSGDDDSKFRISATGTLTFGDLPDHETPGDLDTDNTYEITITATGGTETGSLDVTVYVANVNEAPYFDPSQATRSVVENTGYNQNVGAPVEASDDDDGDSLTYLLGGDDASSFSIDTSTGQILTDADLDHETDDSYTVTVTARDLAGATSSIAVLISVTNANDQPEFPATETGQRSVEENKSNTDVGAPVAASDQDGDGLTYELTGGDTSTFTTNSRTGQLTTVGALDSDTQATYSVTVSVRDGKDDQGGSDTAEDDSITVSITVTDVNETPVVTGDTTPEFAENGSGTVAEYVADDPENGSITWSLSGTHADDMAISGGNLTFNSPPDHETRDTYNVIVQAFDGNSTGTLAVVVTVTDINERPEFSGATTSRSVVENTPAGRNIGLPVVAADQDRGDALTYILDNSAVEFFDIDETTGQLKTKSELNAESRTTYNVNLGVHDGKDDEGNPDTTVDAYIYVTITVENVDEAPILAGTTGPEFLENSALTVAVYDARDPEGETVVWSLSGDDDDVFDITGGALSFLKSPDFEALNEYSVTVNASDGGLTSSLNVTVTIINEDEDGSIGLSSQQPQTGTPLTATLEDPDGNLAGDTWVWESSTSSSWSAISGATSRSYTPVDGDVDSFLRVTASYTDGHGSGKSAQAGRLIRCERRRFKTLRLSSKGPPLPAKLPRTVALE